MEESMPETAKLIYKGNTYELPVVEGTMGETAIDISNLRSATGLITYDPGYVNTGCCKSNITFLDGEKGLLYYRGFPIEQLAEKSNFIETAYLLIYGNLPTKSELDYFSHHVVHHSMLTE